MSGQRAPEDSGRRISWDRINLAPVVKLKFGVKRRSFPLDRVETGTRAKVAFRNRYVELTGSWHGITGFGSRLALRLTNRSSESIRLTRLMFPAEAGVDAYVSGFNGADLAFLRNGHQSWSTARSYLPKDKPLRPWLQLVSLASSNLANLPSNVPGIFSSEMYAVITDRSTGESFLVGQDAPFDQFFYIRLNLYRRRKSAWPAAAEWVRRLGTGTGGAGRRRSYFELTYDFGRKLLPAGETIELSPIIIARGLAHAVLQRYFREVSAASRPRPGKTIPHGWSSWYYYYTGVTPQVVLRNLEAAVRVRDEWGARIDFLQIDDGYEQAVGDWLRLKPEFEGCMGSMARRIRAAGFRPGLWIAPFVAGVGSELLRNHPEYALRDEHGRRIVAGFNVFWRRRFYFGLDITHPQVEEYIRKVIRVIVGTWGYTYLKCDFLFGACLRGGTHHDLTLSRAEVLRRGMEIIREEAASAAAAAGLEEPFLVGCGMPIVCGIGTVDAMRVGPDTGSYWIDRTGRFLRSGAMVGVRNSVRNSLIRAGMHRALWINDPDCLMLRRNGTRLSRMQRRTQINALALVGGLLTVSDDLAGLDEEDLAAFLEVQRIAEQCAHGRLVPWDMMERELPTVVVNTAGYLGVFNMTRARGRRIFVSLPEALAEANRVCAVWGEACRPFPGRLVEVWSGEEMAPHGGGDTVLSHTAPRGVLSVGPLRPYESRLYRFESGHENGR
ncbi:MAG: glycoside hydrolase family 36 protein [Spirochaetaceae bacterium]